MIGNPPPITTTNASETTTKEETTLAPATTAPPSKSSSYIGLIVGLAVGIPCLVVISIVLRYVSAKSDRSKLYMEEGDATNAEDAVRAISIPPPPSTEFTSVVSDVPSVVPEVEYVEPATSRPELRSPIVSISPVPSRDPSPVPELVPHEILPGSQVLPQDVTPPSDTWSDSPKPELPLQISSTGQLVFTERTQQFAGTSRETSLIMQRLSRGSPQPSATQREDGEAKATEAQRAIIPPSSLQGGASLEASVEQGSTAVSSTLGFFGFLQPSGKEGEENEEALGPSMSS
eukprot:526018-Hanusia_phi.AAC.1